MPRESRRWSMATIALALCASACGSGGDVTPMEPGDVISPLAQGYLDQMISLMQNNSVNRRTVDWDMMRTRVFAAAGGAQRISDLSPAIVAALQVLGDGHSAVVTLSGQVLSAPTRACNASVVGTPIVPPTIGYVRIGTFSGNGSAATQFANGIDAAIRAVDRDDLIGWIVDLRGNGGGNMWPMVAGVGPILGPGVVGFFIDPDGVERTWVYRDGGALLDGVPLEVVTIPHTLKRPGPRVAVLTDNGIASSGEATVIAFKGRPNTRSFGEPTCGLSTANRGFALNDGAILLLTVSTMADRTRTVYGDSVFPDEVIVNPAAVVDRAIEWLESGN